MVAASVGEPLAVSVADWVAVAGGISVAPGVADGVACVVVIVAVCVSGCSVGDSVACAVLSGGAAVACSVGCCVVGCTTGVIVAALVAMRVGVAEAEATGALRDRASATLLWGIGGVGRGLINPATPVTRQMIPETHLSLRHP